MRFDREPVTGVINPGDLIQSGNVVVLTPAGTLVKVPLGETKAVCFVRDLPSNEAWRQNRFFHVRPKMEGLWLRLKFRDDDAMEGVTPNNLLLIESDGFHVIPPDPAFQNQRIFVPKAALVDTQVLGVIGSPLRKPAAAKAARKDPPGQIPLFDLEGQA